MRVLVCGSREWDDEPIVFNVLDGYLEQQRYTNRFLPNDEPLVVIQGGAKGADAIAAAWGCENTDVRHEQYPADWATHGKAAGPLRNQQMLDEGKPDVVIAFKDAFQPDIPDNVVIGDLYTVRRPKGGTEDMVRRAKAAGIPVYIVSRG